MKVGEDNKYRFEHFKSIEQKQSEINAYTYFSLAYVDEEGNVFQMQSTHDPENEAVKNPLKFYKNTDVMFPDL